MNHNCKKYHGLIEVLSKRLPGRTEENKPHKNQLWVAGIMVNIETEDLPNTVLEHYL
jgi:hypothetical protein